MAQEQKEKLLRFYKGTDSEAVAKKLVNLAEMTKKTENYRISGFLDPYEQEIAEAVRANLGGFRIDFFGGYLGAEHMRAMFIADDFKGEPTGFDIACICACWRAEFAALTHRDVLGAVLSLGMTRESVGDIILKYGMATILVDGSLAEHLVGELDRIGQVAVKAEIGDLSDIAPREIRTKEIRATVASLRMDAIVAAGFGVSRSRAASDIAADKLRLNWQPVKGASQVVKPGDILSMRGRGRLEVSEIAGQTKKGRMVVHLKRYI